MICEMRMIEIDEHDKTDVFDVFVVLRKTAECPVSQDADCAVCAFTPTQPWTVRVRVRNSIGRSYLLVRRLYSRFPRNDVM